MQLGKSPRAGPLSSLFTVGARRFFFVFRLLTRNRFMGKAKKRYYAVKVGRSSGIFHSWDACNQQVKGYPGAVFQGFVSLSDATAFLKGSGTSQIPGRPTYNTAGGVGGQPVLDETGSGHQTVSNDSCTSVGLRTCDVTGRVVKKYGGKWNSHRGRGKGFSAQQLSQQKYSEELFTEKHLHSGAKRSDSSVPVVYCDGCCINNGGKEAKAGVGVYWSDGSPHNISDRLRGRQTNQRAELQAAYKAIKTAMAQGYSSIEIRTDSLYTINVATKWVVKWKRNNWKCSRNQTIVNKQDVINLMGACEKIKIKWIHVRGHSGEPGNEKADKLAKAGAQKQH